MESSNTESRGSLTDTTCSLSFFDCLAAPNRLEEHRRTSHHIGVEREMKIMYQQPHLVPPMKLTVYDDLPPTPGLPPPSAISQLVSQGRNLASRASTRASLSIRKKSSRAQISRPQLIEGNEVPRRTYRRLELSIYMPTNRLSDLPEFDQVDFTDDGAIQLPPRALLRAKSEEALARVSPPALTRKISSMYEERPSTMQHTRQNTTSSIISTSRPPSEYDALHSHPVSMVLDMPELPPQIHHQPVNSVTVLSPIQDEFTPPTTAMIDAMVTEFHSIDSKVQERTRTERSMSLKRLPLSSGTAPAPTPLKFNFKTRTNSFSTTHSKTHSKSSSNNQNRVANWINHSQASSISSSYSTLTTMTTPSMSFSEHRRKKTQFYQCQPYLPDEPQPLVQPGQVPVQMFTPPKPLPLRMHNRSRTLSASTVASTVETIDTNIMSLDDNDDDAKSDGQSSATTAEAPVVLRGLTKPVDTVVVKEVEMETDVPVMFATVDMRATEGMVVKELNGGLVRSPGVGLAF